MIRFVISVTALFLSGLASALALDLSPGDTIILDGTDKASGFIARHPDGALVFNRSDGATMRFGSGASITFTNNGCWVQVRQPTGSVISFGRWSTFNKYKSPCVYDFHRNTRCPRTVPVITLDDLPEVKQQTGCSYYEIYEARPITP